MTLALYGKSRKRQGSLLLAAFLAIIVASVGGLALITSAFAHNPNSSASSQCNGNWASRLWYENGGSGSGDLRLVLIRDVKVNNVAYDPTWASGISNSSSSTTPLNTGNSIITRTGYGFQNGLPSAVGHTDYIWVGVDSTFDIFNRNQASGALNSNASAWSGTAEVYQWNSQSSSWSDTGFGANVQQPPATGDCAKIIIKKVVKGAGADPSTGFTADVNNTNTDNSGEINNAPFSQNTPYTHIWDEDDTTNDFQVTEDTPPANWTLVGKKVLAGDAACPSSTAPTTGGSGNWDSAGTASGGALDNLANGDTVTVCFLNEYTNPNKTIIVKKVVNDGAPAQNFSTDIDVAGGSTGDQSNKTFSVATPYSETFTGGGTTGSVHEDAPPANWALTGVKVLDGDATCPAFGGSWDAAGDGAFTGLNAGVTKTICFRNTYTPPSSVSVDKTHDPAGPFGPGGTFKWKITLAVTGSATTGVTSITDTIPAPFVAEAFGSYSKSAQITCTDGDANASTVTCSLASGTGTGTYFVEIDITVPAQLTQDQCHAYNNTATITGTNVPTTPGGPTNSQSDTDSVTVSCNPGTPNFSKSDGTKVGSAIQWTITIKNNSQFTTTFFVYDENAAYVSSTVCTSAGENPANSDFFTCTLTAGATGTLTLSTVYPGHSNVCQPLDVTNTAYLVSSNTLTAGQAKDPANQLASDGGSYHEDAAPDKSCLSVVKEKSDTSQPPTWNIKVTNSSGSPVAIYLRDSDTFLNQVVSGGTCAAGDTILGNGLNCTVNANSTLILSIYKTTPEATCQGTDVSNTVSVWLGTFESMPATPADFTANGGTFTGVNANPSLCSHTVKVCKIVVGNGDGIVDGGQFRFGSNPSNAVATITSQTTEPAGDAVDGAQGTKNCVDLIVANTDTTIFEWGYRPGDGQGLTGTWNGDAAGFPRSGATSTNSCDLQTNGTVAINSQTTEVTFCNKTVSRTKEIQVVKIFQNANGSALAPTYVATSADLPTFTMTPNPWTGTGSYVIVDDANCDLQNPNPNVFGWYCSIPAAANPTVTETPKAGWIQSFNGECTPAAAPALLKAVEGLVSGALGVVIQDAVPAVRYTFCNYPVGKIIVQKNDNTSNTNTGRPAQWNFEVDGSQTYQGNVALGGGQWVTENVPFGSYSADETNGHFDPSICPTSGNPNGNGYTSTDLTPGSQSITQPGQTITFIFRNDDCGRVAGTGSLHVFKIRDINGNGQTDGGDTQIVWTVTIQGPEFPAGQVFNVPAAGLHLNGITEGVYTITEASQFGYILVGVASTENPGLVVSTSTSVTIADGTEDTVIFYNQPSGQIPVHKNAFTSHNGGANVAAPNDDDGWTITLTSAQCGINQVKVTDANGDALFTGLPLCNDYVVSEGAVNASSPGFVPLTAAQFTNITPNGVTLTFNNILRTQDPPCINCGPTTTPTPVTPTATPPTTTVVPPTNTPVPPTATPTQPSPVSTQAGERTPGPGQPTPIAPSTGGGVLGGTAGGFNLLLIVAGLLALTSGVSFLALGRKNRR